MDTDIVQKNTETNNMDTGDNITKDSCLPKCLGLSALLSLGITAGYHLLVARSFASKTELSEILSKLDKVHMALVNNKVLGSKVYKAEHPNYYNQLAEDRDRLSRTVNKAAAYKVLNEKTASSVPTYDGGQVVTKVE